MNQHFYEYKGYTPYESKMVDHGASSGEHQSSSNLLSENFYPDKETTYQVRDIDHIKDCLQMIGNFVIWLVKNGISIQVSKIFCVFRIYQITIANLILTKQNLHDVVFSHWNFTNNFESIPYVLYRPQKLYEITGKSRISVNLSRKKIKLSSVRFNESSENLPFDLYRLILRVFIFEILPLKSRWID